MTLVLPNVKMESSNVRKKIKELLNVIKVRSHVMLVLPNVTMKSSNVRKKKGIIECVKSKVTCDVGIAQCDNGTIKCEKKQNKIMVPQIVTKVWLDVMLVLPNVTMKFSNVRKK